MKVMIRKMTAISLGVFLFCAGTLVFVDVQQARADIGQHNADVHRHATHYYRNGRWYRHGWFGWDVAVPVLPSTGVYVDTLPPAYTPVVIQGTTYYYSGNTYFRALPQGGYTVVSAPAQ